MDDDLRRMSKPRLAGTALRCMFEHYGTNRKLSKTSFLRYMLVSKSTRATARQPLRDMVLSQTKSAEPGYRLDATEANDFFEHFLLADSTTVAVFVLLRPQSFAVRVDPDFNLERWNILSAHLSGVNKLCLDTDDLAIVPFARNLAEHLLELGCSINMLELLDSPSLKLNVFKLRYTPKPIDFSHIFRYEIKKLDLTDIKHIPLNEIQFGESTNNNITFLRLSIVNATLTGDLSSFMSKFHDHVPSLETVELSIHVDQSFLEQHNLTGQLIGIYNDIMSFKERFQGILKGLSIHFFADSFVAENDEDYESEWMTTLGENEAFKHAEFKSGSDFGSSPNVESVKLNFHEDTEVMKFSLSFEVEILILNETEFQQVLDDNLDWDVGQSDHEWVDDANSDEDYEVDYDYSGSDSY